MIKVIDMSMDQVLQFQREIALDMDRAEGFTSYSSAEGEDNETLWLSIYVTQNFQTLGFSVVVEAGEASSTDLRAGGLVCGVGDTLSEALESLRHDLKNKVEEIQIN